MTLYYNEQENTDGVLFAADIVEYNFIFTSLEIFGFGDKFI